jgi:carboxyl-terminal processing protease
MSFKTRLSVLLLSTPILAFVLVGGLMGKERAFGEQSFPHLRVFDDVVELVTENYVGEVKIDRVMEGAMRGLADGLDPDSAFLNPSQVKALEAGDVQPDGDVGIELTRRYYLHVIASRDGSPADKAGLQTGDTVRAIDGKPTRDMSVFEASRLLRGQAGSKVNLTIFRGNAAEPHDLTLVREKSSGPLVQSRMLGDAGYVRIVSFRNGVADELRKHAADLGKTGAKALIVDVRGTAEGPFDNGLAAARVFVKTGTLAFKAGRNTAGPRESITAAAGDGSVTVPVALLQTTGTTGAAELFVAALKGNRRAESIGERSLGRAGIQKLVKLPEGRGLWLTYARYLTPAGVAIQGRGIEPDLIVEEPEIEFGTTAVAKDPILDAAIEHLKSKSAR